MRKILLAVDNSNIIVPTFKSFGIEARFGYTNFEKKFHANDVFVEKLMTGSTPPSTDAFWEKMRGEGYNVITYERKKISNGRTTEKVVDTDIVARTTEAIINLKPDILVLLGGDKDMIPLAQMGKKYLCSISMWSYRSSSSGDLEKLCNAVYYIDDYVEDLIFFQNEQGRTESFSEYKDRKAFEKKKVNIIKKRAITDCILSDTSEEVSDNEVNKRTNISDNDNEKVMPTWQKVVLGIGAAAAAFLVFVHFKKK